MSLMTILKPFLHCITHHVKKDSMTAEIKPAPSCETLQVAPIPANGLSPKANAYLTTMPDDYDKSAAECILKDFESFVRESLPQSNTEFVADLMDRSESGGMSQLFIVEAIRYYAERVANQPMPDNKTEDFINPRDWWHCAREIMRKVRAKYEGVEETLEDVLPTTSTDAAPTNAG